MLFHCGLLWPTLLLSFSLRSLACVHVGSKHTSLGQLECVVAVLCQLLFPA
jgi:hypothetical protein